MCDTRAPQDFIKVRYRHKCFNCDEDLAYYLLIPKCGPLRSASSVRASYFIPISSITCIDDWEIELKLKKQEVGQIELAEYDDEWVPDFALCAASEWECGVLNEEQLNTGRLMFEELSRQLATMGM